MSEAMVGEGTVAATSPTRVTVGAASGPGGGSSGRPISLHEQLGTLPVYSPLKS